MILHCFCLRSALAAGFVFIGRGIFFNKFNDLTRDVFAAGIFDAFEPRHSAGIGIRWRSPLGPIRLDIARAVDEHRDWRLHLSMGPDL